LGGGVGGVAGGEGGWGRRNESSERRRQKAGEGGEKRGGWGEIGRTKKRWGGKKDREYIPQCGVSSEGRTREGREGEKKKGKKGLGGKNGREEKGQRGKRDEIKCAKVMMGGTGRRNERVTVRRGGSGGRDKREKGQGNDWLKHMWSLSPGEKIFWSLYRKRFRSLSFGSDTRPFNSVTVISVVKLNMDVQGGEAPDLR